MSDPRTRWMAAALLAVVAAGAAAQGQGDGRLVVVPPVAAVRPGESVRFAAAAVRADGTRIVPDGVTWIATGGTIDDEGIFTAGAGEGWFAVSAQWGLEWAQARVLVRAAAGGASQVSVEPSVAQMQVGQRAQFQAIALDAQNRVVVAPLVWDATGGTIAQDGTFEATAEGAYTVAATSVDGSALGVATVLVGRTPNVGTLRVTLTPPLVTVQVGGTVQLDAFVHDTLNRPAPGRVLWSASGGGTLSPTGQFRATTPGVHLVTAAVEQTGIFGAATVVVSRFPLAPLAGVLVMPRVASLQLGDSVRLQAMPFDADGRLVSAPVRWAATGGLVSPRGLFVATAPGVHTVTAEAVGTRLAGSARIVVDPEPLARLVRVVLTPPRAQLRIGQSIQFAADAYDEHGRVVPAPLRWTCSQGGTIAPTGLFTPRRPGAHTVTVEVAGTPLVDTARILVGPAGGHGPRVARVVVTPSRAALRLGEGQQFAAAAYDDRGRPVATRLVWACTPGGTITPAGLFTPGRPGAHTVTVQVAGTPLTDTAAVVVGPGGGHHGPRVARLVVTPQQAVLRTGDVQQFTAAAYDDRGRPAVAVPIEWACTGKNTISPDGHLKARFPGVCRVTAQVKGTAIGDSVTVTVASVLLPVARVTVTPPKAALRPGETVQFQATCHDARGGVVPAPVTWAATGGVITGTGRFTAQAPGLHRVTATVARTRIEGHATVAIGQAGGPPPHGAGLTVTKWDFDRKFLRVEIKADVTVRGRAAHELKLYAIDRRGGEDRLDTEPAKDGATVRLSGHYAMGAAEHVEVRLYDPAGRLLAAERHKAK